MASIEDDLKVVNELEAIYDDEYRPLSQEVFKLFPRKEGEASEDYSIRLAVHSRWKGNEVFEETVRKLYTPAKKFCRLFILASEEGKITKYAAQSGYARAFNIFVMLFPHDTAHWFMMNSVDKELSWENMFHFCSTSTVFYKLFSDVLYKAAVIDIEPFPSVSMKNLMLNFI